MDLRAGDHFAGLRIDGVAGRGGMGVVYRAVQPSLDRTVALKTIATALAADPAFASRFVRESKAAAAVEHPNVLPIFSAGEEEGVLYIVMRYVDGPDLRSLIREHGPLAPERAAHIVAQVAAALDAAHARGLVHRDVKPANVLLNRTDHAYLTDFGLTKRVTSTAASEVTRAGGWVGTLGYVAPEQIRDERIDARTDVYALGCVLHHALTGAPPYDRGSDEATLWAHLNDPPPALPGDVPDALADAVHRALAKAPGDRFPTAGDLGRAVLTAVGRSPHSVAGLETPLAPSAVEETRITPAEARPDAHLTSPTTPADGDDVTPTHTTTAAADATGPRRPPALLPAAIAVGIAVVVLAFILAQGGGRGPNGRSAKTQTVPAKASVAPRVQSVAIGGRPNGVAVAGGNAYVTIPSAERLRQVGTDRFDRAKPGPRVGRGALDIDTGYGALWVTTSTNRERLVKVDLETGLRTVHGLPDGAPVAVEAGENAIWVGMRGARFKAEPKPKVLRIDPETMKVVRTIEIPRGLQDMAVGGGAVWVTNRSRDTVTRIDVKTGEQQTINVGRGPSGLAIGAGSVWTANAEGDTVTRIDRESLRSTATVTVSGQPRFAVFGGGDVWVSTFGSSSLVRLDGDTAERVEDPLDLQLNPTKLAVSRNAVYVVSTAGGRLERVRFGKTPSATTG